MKDETELDTIVEDKVPEEPPKTLEQLASTVERLSWTNYFLAREPKWKATHRHYKGGLYRILNLSRHTETGEVFVNYDNKAGEVWSRPVEEFYGQVEVNTSDMTSIMVKRFEPIKDVEDDKAESREDK